MSTPLKMNVLKATILFGSFGPVLLAVGIPGRSTTIYLVTRLGQPQHRRFRTV